MEETRRATLTVRESFDADGDLVFELHATTHNRRTIDALAESLRADMIWVADVQADGDA